MYKDDLLRNWKQISDDGLMLKRNLYLDIFQFADDQVLIQNSEEKLQISVSILNQMSED